MEYHQEPMTLGSPLANSPSNTSLHQHHTPAGSQFLPGFLMGDQSISTTPLSPRPTTGQLTQGGFQNHTGFGLFSPKTSPKAKFGSQSHVRFGSASKSLHHHTMSVNEPQTPASEKDKPGAPPVSALINDSNTSYSTPGLGFSSPRNAVINVQRSTAGTPLGGPGKHTEPRKILGLASNLTTSPTSGYQANASNSDYVETETWVTVFGFPISASSFILQQFSRYGYILEHHQAPNNGNWVHIKFESKLQAKKALLKSGKVFPGNIMIGVNPCTDQTIMRSSNQENLSMMQTLDAPAQLYNTPNLTSFNNSRLNMRAVNSPKLTPMRPIASAYNANSNEIKVFSDAQTPQKSNGIVSKTWDYLFG